MKGCLFISNPHIRIVHIFFKADLLKIGINVSPFFFYIYKFGLKPFLDKGMIPLTENDTSVLSCPYVCPDATSMQVW